MSAGNFLYVKQKPWEEAVFPSGVQWAEGTPDICLMPYTHLLFTYVFSAGLEICLSVASRHELGHKGILGMNLKEKKPNLSINKSQNNFTEKKKVEYDIWMK